MPYVIVYTRSNPLHNPQECEQYKFCMEQKYAHAVGRIGSLGNCSMRCSTSCIHAVVPIATLLTSMDGGNAEDCLEQPRPPSLAVVGYNQQPQNLFTGESIVAFFILMLKMCNLFVRAVSFISCIIVTAPSPRIPCG
jgi:hypothetical protein